MAAPKKPAPKPGAKAKPEARGGAGADKQGGDAPKPKPKKLVIKDGAGNVGRVVALTVVMVVILASGVIGVTYVLKNFESLAAGPPPVEEIPGYVNLDAVAVPVSLANALDHYASLDLRFQVRDGARQKEVEAVLPRIRDALVRDAHHNALLRTDGVASVDLARIKDRAKAAANQILGADLIANVYVIRVAKLVA